MFSGIDIRKLVLTREGSEVYDTLGYDGLKLNFPAQLKGLPKDEVSLTFMTIHKRVLICLAPSCATRVFL